MQQFTLASLIALFCTFFFSFCNHPNKLNLSKDNDTKSQPTTFPILPGLESDLNSQIGEFVVKVFEDSKGNLWFGTVSKGVACYNGKSLNYFTKNDGLPGNAVVSIVEDQYGNIWFGTHSGLAKYDGKTFTSFTENEGLCDNRVSNLLIDRIGNFWVGTWDGVCQFNGLVFSDFQIPIPDVNLESYQVTMNWVTALIEDQKGNIWFGRDGYGACKYNGTSFTHFTKKDGLASNNIQEILEDSKGNIWFGSRIIEKDSPDANNRIGDGGLNRYDGKEIIKFPTTKGLHQNEIYALYKDKKGNLWIGSNGVGLYKYHAGKFVLFSETDRKDLMPYGYGIQSILEDRQGIIWLGLSGGLFRLQDSVITNITIDGPWD